MLYLLRNPRGSLA